LLVLLTTSLPAAGQNAIVSLSLNPEGEKTASLVITTGAVTEQTRVRITGVYGGAVRSAKLTVKP